MLQRLGNLVIWKYSEDTPPERLQRHYRIACAVARVGWGSALLMASSMAGFLASRDGWMRTVEMVIVIASTAVCFVTFIPGMLAGIWAQEAATALEARGIPLADPRDMSRWVPRTVGKLVYWFVVIVLIASAVRR